MTLHVPDPSVTTDLPEYAPTRTQAQSAIQKRIQNAEAKLAELLETADVLSKTIKDNIVSLENLLAIEDATRARNATYAFGAATKERKVYDEYISGKQRVSQKDVYKLWMRAISNGHVQHVGYELSAINGWPTFNIVGTDAYVCLHEDHPYSGMSTRASIKYSGFGSSYTDYWDYRGGRIWKALTKHGLWPIVVSEELTKLRQAEALVSHSKKVVSSEA